MSETQEPLETGGQSPTKPAELSFWDLFKQRFLHPFLGWFSTSFILWNWKAFLMLIWSKRPIEEIIVSIEIYFTLGSAWNFFGPVLIGMLLGVTLTPISSLLNSGAHVLEGFVEAIQTKAIQIRLPYSIAHETLVDEEKRRKKAAREQDGLRLQVRGQTIQILELRSKVDLDQQTIAELNSLKVSLETECRDLRKKEVELTGMVRSLEELLSKSKKDCELAKQNFEAASKLIEETQVGHMQEMENTYLAYLSLRSLINVGIAKAIANGSPDLAAALTPPSLAGATHSTVMNAAKNFLRRRGKLPQSHSDFPPLT